MAIYSYTTRIRYLECDEQARLTYEAMLNLYQTTSTFQSEDLGVGVQYLKDEKKAWVVTNWHMVIQRMPTFGEEVTVQTWSHGFKSFMGFRNFRIISSLGETLTYADSTWVYVDADKGALSKCPESEIALYGEDPALDMPKRPRKISIPELSMEQEAFSVKKYFLDTNHHMNNTKYILVSMEYLPADFNVKEIRVEYKKSALFNDTVIPYVSTTGSEVIVQLKNPSSETYANVEFTA